MTYLHMGERFDTSSVVQHEVMFTSCRLLGISLDTVRNLNYKEDGGFFYILYIYLFLARQLEGAEYYSFKSTKT